MEPSETTSVLINETISDELDRLEIPAGKIGLINSAQALGFLRGLDHVSDRIQTLDPNSSSRQRVEVQFDGIVARLHAEAGRFIRDVGGLRAYQQARDGVNPPETNRWWYLDQYVAAKRQAVMKRTLIIGGSLAVLLLILVLLYNRFLAPDPQVAARYSAVQSGQDAMMTNDLPRAAQEVEQGLKAAPNDPELLIMKGVIQEQQGQADRAQQSYAVAQQGIPERENFFIVRAQAFAMVNQPQKALADAQQAIKLNAQSAQAYLVLGQANEMLFKFQDAMDAYDLAFAAANQTDQPALAAMARTRTAMLMQQMNMQQLTPPSLLLTPTSTTKP